MSRKKYFSFFTRFVFFSSFDNRSREWVRKKFREAFFFFIATQKRKCIFQLNLVYFLPFAWLLNGKSRKKAPHKHESLADISLVWIILRALKIIQKRLLCVLFLDWEFVAMWSKQKRFEMMYVSHGMMEFRINIWYQIRGLLGDFFQWQSESILLQREWFLSYQGILRFFPVFQDFFPVIWIILLPHPQTTNIHKSPTRVISQQRRLMNCL